MAQPPVNICPVGLLSLEGLFFSKEEMGGGQPGLESCMGGA